jgi:hypothetical protein
MEMVSAEGTENVEKELFNYRKEREKKRIIFDNFASKYILTRTKAKQRKLGE